MKRILALTFAVFAVTAMSSSPVAADDDWLNWGDDSYGYSQYGEDEYGFGFDGLFNDEDEANDWYYDEYNYNDNGYVGYGDDESYYEDEGLYEDNGLYEDYGYDNDYSYGEDEYSDETPGFNDGRGIFQ